MSKTQPPRGHKGRKPENPSGFTYQSTERRDSAIPFPVLDSDLLADGGQAHVYLVSVLTSRLDPENPGPIGVDRSIATIVGDAATFVLKVPSREPPIKYHERRLRREKELLELAAGLRVPRLGGYHFDDHTPSRSWLAMNYINGYSLNEAVAGNPLPPDETLLLAVGLWEALALIHERGIAHRDVTWWNVIVPRLGDAPNLAAPALLDFGLGWHENVPFDHPMRDAQTGSRMGTVGFRPPEVMRDEEEARTPLSEFAIDTFQWGCCVYAAWCGHPPFDGEAERRLAFDSTAIEVELLPKDLSDMPMDLGKAVEIALSRHPENRRVEGIEAHLPLLGLGPAGAARIRQLQEDNDTSRKQVAEMEEALEAVRAAQTRHDVEADLRRQTEQATQAQLKKLRRAERSWEKDRLQKTQLEKRLADLQASGRTASDQLKRLQAELARRDRVIAQGSGRQRRTATARRAWSFGVTIVGSYIAFAGLRMMTSPSALSARIISVAVVVSLGIVGALLARLVATRIDRGSTLSGVTISMGFVGLLVLLAALMAAALAAGDLRRVSRESADRLAARFAGWWPPPPEVGYWTDAKNVVTGDCLKRVSDFPGLVAVVRCDLPNQASAVDWLEIANGRSEETTSGFYLARECQDAAMKFHPDPTTQEWGVPDRNAWERGERGFLCVLSPLESSSPSNQIEWVRIGNGSIGDEAWAMDLEGDGREEVLMRYFKHTTWWIGTINDKKELEWGEIANTNEEDKVLMGNFVGDTRNEILLHYPGGAWWMGRDSKGEFDWRKIGRSGSPFSAWSADVIRDSYQEILLHYDNGPWWIGFLDRGQIRWIQVGRHTAGDETRLVDLVGDSRMELVSIRHPSGPWMVARSYRWWSMRWDRLVTNTPLRTEEDDWITVGQFVKGARSEFLVHDDASGVWRLGVIDGLTLNWSSIGRSMNHRSSVGNFLGGQELQVLVRYAETDAWWLGSISANGGELLWTQVGTLDADDVLVGDYDDDGRDDVLVHVEETGEWWLGNLAL